AYCYRKYRYFRPAGAVAQILERLSGILRAAAVTDDKDALQHVVRFAIDHIEQGIAQIGAANQLLVDFLAFEELVLGLALQAFRYLFLRLGLEPVRPIVPRPRFVSFEDLELLIDAVAEAVEVDRVLVAQALEKADLLVRQELDDLVLPGIELIDR